MFSLPRVSRKTIFVLLFLGIIQVSCTNHSSPAQSFAERACIDSLVRANRNLDSMEIWLEKFSREQNHIGLIFVCRELGKRYREKSRFSEALAIHNRGLRLAIELADTLEIADAYNNIGTDLRRMGMLSEAANSHHQALHIAGKYTGNETRQNRKNYVYALNGIGNIYKTLDNRNEAEHYFRRALKIETEMGNELGQAINWANLGSIYKYRQQYDSAYLCFTRSLEHNERARSKLGIALCHTHFGQIHECRGDYELAFGEYNISYRLLKAIPDKWNWLKSCTALASLHFRRGNLPKAKKILDEALITAREIHSFSHLEELHLLRSEYYERLGICRNALHELKLSHQYRDSLLTAQNESMVYETQIRYERDKKAREIAELNEQNERQIRSRRQVTITSGIIILLTFMILGVLVYALRMKTRSQQATRRMAAMQQSFFTNITHEFRTPLTIILGLAERQMAASSDKACRSSSGKATTCWN
jgi:two-component system sensor histidine kinase ChiS